MTDLGEIILFQTEDGQTKIQVRFDEQTVWLSQKLIADLYQVSVKTINEHLVNIYAEKELPSASTIRKFRIVQTEGKREVTRTVDHFNLQAILAVGYRVRSHRGTQFRQWATSQLEELLVKGFILDDDKIKQGGNGTYFEELLARIRDIRSSERVFWRKVLDIYATSIDYEPNSENSHLFFKNLQNKMHWAAHGQTAAEVIHGRVDASQPNMGLTNWDGAKPRKSDVSIAKNYLTPDELEALNRIVTVYLEFAELQALNRKSMYMIDWIKKLDDFLRISDREILTHVGKISHDQALDKAASEFLLFQEQLSSQPQRVDQHFAQSLVTLDSIENEAKSQVSPPQRTKKNKND